MNFMISRGGGGSGTKKRKQKSFLMPENTENSLNSMYRTCVSFDQTKIEFLFFLLLSCREIFSKHNLSLGLCEIFTLQSLRLSADTSFNIF